MLKSVFDQDGYGGESVYKQTLARTLMHAGEMPKAAC
jgi:hypothetical protein